MRFLCRIGIHKYSVTESLDDEGPEELWVEESRCVHCGHTKRRTWKVKDLERLAKMFEKRFT